MNGLHTGQVGAALCDDDRRGLAVVDFVVFVDAPEIVGVVAVDDFEASVQLGPRGPYRVGSADPFPPEDLVVSVDPHHHAVSRTHVLEQSAHLHTETAGVRQVGLHTHFHSTAQRDIP